MPDPFTPTEALALGAAFALQVEYMDWRNEQGLSPALHEEAFKHRAKVLQRINDRWALHDFYAATMDVPERLP
jgi:hypothetical protein